MVHHTPEGQHDVCFFCHPESEATIAASFPSFEPVWVSAEIVSITTAEEAKEEVRMMQEQAWNNGHMQDMPGDAGGEKFTVLFDCKGLPEEVVKTLQPVKAKTEEELMNMGFENRAAIPDEAQFFVRNLINDLAQVQQYGQVQYGQLENRRDHPAAKATDGVDFRLLHLYGDSVSTAAATAAEEKEEEEEEDNANADADAEAVGRQVGTPVPFGGFGAAPGVAAGTRLFGGAPRPRPGLPRPQLAAGGLFGATATPVAGGQFPVGFFGAAAAPVPTSNKPKKKERATVVQHLGIACAASGINPIEGTVRVFRQNFALDDAIGSPTCSLEADMRVTNGIPLGSPLLLSLSS
jgi:hypothetical protein